MIQTANTFWTGLTAGARGLATDVRAWFSQFGQTPAQAVARAQEQSRVQTMRRARAAYDGIYPDPLTPTRDGKTDAIKINSVETAVDVMVAFLAGTPPIWEIVDPRPPAPTRPMPPPAPMPPMHPMPPAEAEAPADAETDMSADGGEAPADEATEPPDPIDQLLDAAATALRACLVAEAWDTRRLDHAQEGALTGTPYFRLYPPLPGTPWPRLRVLDSECLSIETDPRDVETVTAYVWLHATTDPLTQRDRWDRQRIDRLVTADGGTIWRITDAHADRPDGGAVWVEDGSEDWPYAWAPIVHCKNRPNPGSAYGKPDVTDLLIQLVQAHNQNLTNRQRIDRFHGSPLTVLTGAKLDALQVGPDAAIELEIGDTLQMLYPHIDSTAAAGLAREIFQGFCQMAAIPSFVLGHVDEKISSDPSGAALRAELVPAMIRLELKRTLYGPCYRAVLEHLLELIDSRYAGLQISVEFGEVLPTDPLTERRVLALDMDAGVLSKESYADKVGIPWAKEYPRLQAEKAVAVAAARALMPPGGLAPAAPADGAPNKEFATLKTREITKGIAGE